MASTQITIDHRPPTQRLAYNPEAEETADTVTIVLDGKPFEARH